MPTQKQSNRVVSVRIAVWLVLVCTLLCRLAYFVEHLQSPFFGVPILDEAYYDSVAKVLAGHDPRATAHLEGGFRPLFYPFLVSLAYRWAGSAAEVWVVVIQHLIGVATALVVTVIATRLFEGRAAAGLAAGLLYSLAGPPLFYEGELLNTSLFTVALMVQVLLLQAADIHRRKWLLAGVWTALAAQLRPNALILGGIYLWKSVRPQRRFAWFGLVGLGGTVLIVAALEAPLIGKWRIAGGSGAINLYLGNKIGADGMVPRQDAAVTYGSDYRDSVEVFSELASASSDVGETRFWLRRTLDDIGSSPGRWLRLMLGKGTYLLTNEEIPSNRSYLFSRSFESETLRWLPIRWWFLLSFGTLGVLVAYRRSPRSSLFSILLTMLALLATVMVAFFVNSRFRAPLWPLMSIFAGGGLYWMLTWLRLYDWGRLARSIAVVLAVAMISLYPWVDQEVLHFGRDFYFRSLASYQHGDLSAADDDVRRSLLLGPPDAAARFQLGTVALAEGRYHAAIHSFRTAIDLQPGEARIYNNLGVALEKVEQVNAAYRAYQQSLALAPDYTPALVNASLIELRAGLWQAAERKIESAKKLGDDSLSLLCASAFIAAARGDDDRARELLAVASSIDREVTEELLRDHQRRLVIATPANGNRK